MDQRIAKLINFQILEKSEEKISAELLIDENLPSFKGHFPGNPILPAVSIIDICLFLLAEVKPNICHSDIEVKRSKFMAMVRPNQKVSIEATSDDGSNWRLTWLAQENQSKLAQVHLVI